MLTTLYEVAMMQLDDMSFASCTTGLFLIRNVCIEKSYCPEDYFSKKLSDYIVVDTVQTRTSLLAANKSCNGELNPIRLTRDEPRVMRLLCNVGLSG